MPEFAADLQLVHALAAIGGYVAGSIPFGLLFTRMVGIGNLREIGSGNVGATNVLRTGRKGVAAATLLCDAGKGAAAVLVAGLWGREPALIAAVAAVLGHNFPVWLWFKGGKGAATTAGVLAALAWPVAALCIVIWIAVAAATRYSSVAALTAGIAAPFLAWWLSTDDVAILMVLLTVLGIIRHHANIRRLIAGEEPKFKLAASAPQTDEPTA